MLSLKARLPTSLYVINLDDPCESCKEIGSHPMLLSMER